MTTRTACTVVVLVTGVVGLAASASAWKQVAYVKASNPRAGAQFGYAVALSSDGRTLAVGSQMEESAATGVNGNQNDHSMFSAGAVYVYARTGDRWAQQAYVKASNTGADDQFGFAVALSADGNTLAVSAPYEDSAATGIDGNQADNSMANSGAVYIFTRSGGAWSQQAYVKASNTGAAEEGDQFGYSIALSGDGSMLVVGAIGEDSDATGINGDQNNEGAQSAGAAYVFTRSGRIWSQQAYVKAANTMPNFLFGYSVAMNANGNTMAIGSFDEGGSSREINGPYDRRRAGSGAVYVFTRNGPPPPKASASLDVARKSEVGTSWSQQAYLKAKEGDAQDSMGCWVAISDDGNTVAAGALDEDTLVPGVNVVQSGHSGRVDAPDDTSAGAAYVFVRNGPTPLSRATSRRAEASGEGGTAWSEQANFKASNVGKTDWFGVRLNLSGDGHTMAVSAPNEDSAAQGINGKQDDESADEAGAVYVFTRDGPTPLSRATSRRAEASGEGGSTWSRNQIYFKGSNTEKFDEFGSAVALSRDGRTMAVGAHFESGGARGINGNQADNSMSQSGAVYIFVR